MLSRLRVPVAFALLSLAGHKNSTKEPFEKVRLPSGQIEVTRLSETAGLTIERVRFWSERMREPRYFITLAPRTPAPPGEVLILNHGWFDRPEYLLKYLHLDEVYAALLARGELRPAILVIPDVRFKNILRLRSDPDPGYLQLVAEEIPDLVSRRYGIPLERDRWAIGGFSFGGYLSLDIGRRYPGQFASVSMVSGLFDAKWSFWPSNSQVDSAPRLFLACGTEDWLFGTMRSLHNGLDRMGISAEWTTAPGGHTWKYWSSVLQSMLKFHLGTRGN